MNAAVHKTTSKSATLDRVALLQKAGISESQLRRRAKNGTLNARDRALLRQINALDYVASGRIADAD